MSVLVRNTEQGIHTFLLQQPGPDGDLAFLLAIVMAFLAVLTLCFGLLYLQQSQRRLRQTLYALEIRNSGNVPTTFDVRVEERTTQLGFEVYLQHELLIEKVTTAPKTYTPQAAVTAKKGSALSSARQATTFGASLVSLLPGPLAKPLKSALGGLSKGTMMAAQAERVSKAGGQLAKSTKGMAPSAATLAGGANGDMARGSSAPEVELEVIDRWYETPRIVPGNTLELTLAVDWSRGTPRQRYPFRIVSQSSQQPSSPQVSTTGALVAKETWWERALPVSVGISATVAGALFVVLIAVSISLVV